MTKYIVNIDDIVERLTHLGGKATTRRIQDEVLARYCGGTTPENYGSERNFRQTIQRKIEDYCPQAAGFNELKREAMIDRVGKGVYNLRLSSPDFKVSGEEFYSAPLVEGALKLIWVNAYERNTRARSACIEHYGCVCSACGFDFEDMYGELGKNYIHVHHLKSLSEIGREYVVDPINDLRPLCPNCHAMIHRKNESISIEELKLLINMK